MMNPQPNPITAFFGRVIHRLTCIVCNPFIVARRGRETDKVRDNAHIVWADKLAQEARRERLRKAVDSLEDVTPWEADLLMNLGGHYSDGGVIVTSMPPQHPQMRPYA